MAKAVDPYRFPCYSCKKRRRKKEEKNSFPATFLTRDTFVARKNASLSLDMIIDRISSITDIATSFSRGNQACTIIPLNFHPASSPLIPSINHKQQQQQHR